MKAYFINAEKREVTEIDIPDAYPHANEKIGCQWIACGHMDENGDSFYVDDEGLLTSPQHFFLLEDSAQPAFAGNSVVLGLDNETGESQDVVASLDEIKERIKWADKNTIGLMAQLGALD